jgi:tRNA (guanine-N7-)-methyltransferase
MFIDYSKYPYPRKIRHHVGANLYFPIEELAVRPNYYPPLFEKIDFTELFLNGREANVLDVGCGKGKFLLDYASLFPEDNILGFEVRKLLVEWLQSVIQGENIPNANALWYTCVNGFDFLKENSIDKVFYLFPDPWPKKRQQNRRLFSIKFLDDLHRIIKHNGYLYLATDCDYVNEYHLKLLESSNKFEFHKAEPEEWNFPITNKENFCIEKGIPTFKLICKPKK